MAAETPLAEAPPATHGKTREGRSQLRRRLRWRRVLAVAILLAAAAIFHQPVLRIPAWALVVDQPFGDPDCVFLCGGDGRYDFAAEVLRDDARRSLLVMERQPERMLDGELFPTEAAIARRQLDARGISPESVEVLPGRCPHRREAARRLATRLQTQPDLQMVVYCEQFRSRELRIHLDRACDDDARARVHVRALPDRRYAPSNWWNSRAGMRALVFAWLRLSYTWLDHRPVEPPAAWDPDTYDRQRQRPGETAALLEGRAHDRQSEPGPA